MVHLNINYDIFSDTQSKVSMRIQYYIMTIRYDLDFVFKNELQITNKALNVMHV